MALTAADIRHLLRGFPQVGLHLVQEPASWSNPLRLHLRTASGEHRLRLWLFEVTPGGGSSDSRPADEFRFQISNGPSDAMDPNGYYDLALGYETTQDVVFGGNRAYLQHYLSKVTADPESSPSPSVQIKQAQINAGKLQGFHHFTKTTQIGNGPTAFLTFRPEYLPAVLAHPQAAWGGNFVPSGALASLAPAMPSFTTYAASKGFTFPPRLVGRYVAALASKPFVIFSGVSGTGKTKLAHLVAEYYSLREASIAGTTPAPSPSVGDVAILEGLPASVDRSRIAFVSVRPDWTDSRALLGFHNPITEKYQATETLVMLLRATEAAAAATATGEALPPYFLVLDEMNLARVEHYFSDFLSCLETRKPGAGGTLEQEPLVLHDQQPLPIEVPAADGSGTQTLLVPPRLRVPVNLYVTGTVNVDETTYGFSPKVLDRAHVLEFDEVDLDVFHGAPQPTTTTPEPSIPERLPPYEVAGKVHYTAIDDALHARLTHLNGLFESARLHLGYRSAAEIALFAQRYSAILPPSLPVADRQGEVLDAVLMQKVLPRLQGNKARLQVPLAALLEYLQAGAPVPATAAGAPALIVSPAALEGARRRVEDMLATLTSFGFVSFFK